jgi:hypothetical protein
VFSLESMIKLWGVGVTCAWLFCAMAYAGNATNREIVRTFSQHYLISKKNAAAIRALQEHLREDPSDFGAWNLLGLSQMEDKKWIEAAQSFARAAQGSKGESQAIYYYNQGEALAKAAQKKQAKDAFELAAREPRVRPGAQEALRALKSDQQIPAFELAEPGRWDGSITLNAGYDTNVILASETSAAELTASDQASVLSGGLISLNYTHKTRTRRWTISGNVGGSYYLASAASTYTNLSSSLNSEIQILPKDFSGALTSFVQRFDLNQLNSSGLSFYSWVGTLGWKSLLKSQSGAAREWSVFVNYQKYRVSDGDELANDRSGPSLIPKWRLISDGDWGLWIWALKAEAHFSRGQNYRSYSPGTDLSLSGAWGPRTTTQAKLDLVYTLYPESSTRRKDWTLRGSAGVSWKWTSNWLIGADYEFLKNLSSVESGAYSKHTGTVSLTYEGI